MDFKLLMAFVTFMATFFSFCVCLRLIFVDLTRYAFWLMVITIVVDVMVLHHLMKDENIVKG